MEKIGKNGMSRSPDVMRFVKTSKMGV